MDEKEIYRLASTLQRVYVEETFNLDLGGNLIKLEEAEALSESIINSSLKDINNFSLSLEGTEMTDDVFTHFGRIIVSMEELKSLKLNVTKCSLTPFNFYQFTEDLDPDRIEELHITALKMWDPEKKTWWEREPKKRDKVYEALMDKKIATKVITM